MTDDQLRIAVRVAALYIASSFFKTQNALDTVECADEFTKWTYGEKLGWVKPSPAQEAK